MSLRSKIAFAGRLTDAQVCDLIAEACPAKDYSDKKVLVIVPDETRTAPVGRAYSRALESRIEKQTVKKFRPFDDLVRMLIGLVVREGSHGWRGRSPHLGGHCKYVRLVFFAWVLLAGTPAMEAGTAGGLTIAWTNN